jgi:hypothetical protein
MFGNHEVNIRIELSNHQGKLPSILQIVGRDLVVTIDSRNAQIFFEPDTWQKLNKKIQQ